jgi:hypothetical protein
MRIFIPTKGRAQTIRTHLAFKGLDYIIVVHNDQEWKKYISNPSVPRGRVVVSGVPTDVFGLTRQREWICNNLADPGEWFLFADDNIKYIEAVPRPWYEEDDYTYVYKLFPGTRKNRPYNKEWSNRFKQHAPSDYFHWICDGMVAKANAIGARMAGFGTTTNYFFRSVHWATVRYISGKMYLLKNVGVPYDHTISMEDFNNTAEHLARFGKVLINNFVRPAAGHYEAGGMGRLEERTPIRRADCIKLMEKWPGLFRYKKLKATPPKTDLAIKLHNEEQVAAWRASLRQPIPEPEYVYPLEA